MAEELQRVDSNLKPSELKAAFKRSRDIDALLDKERELKEKEVQLLILGKNTADLTNSWVAISASYRAGLIFISRIFQAYNPRSYFAKPANQNTFAAATTPRIAHLRK